MIFVPAEVYEMGDTHGMGVGENYPVCNVAWLQALEFCNALSEIERLEICYTFNAEVSCNFLANGYRLPTEAEWKWAARGAQIQPDYLHNGNDNIDEVAIYIFNDPGGTATVGSKMPYDIDLCDLSGNIWE